MEMKTGAMREVQCNREEDIYIYQSCTYYSYYLALLCYFTKRRRKEREGRGEENRQQLKKIKNEQQLFPKHTKHSKIIIKKARKCR